MRQSSRAQYVMTISRPSAISYTRSRASVSATCRRQGLIKLPRQRDGARKRAAVRRRLAARTPPAPRRPLAAVGDGQGRGPQQPMPSQMPWRKSMRAAPSGKAASGSTPRALLRAWTERGPRHASEPNLAAWPPQEAGGRRTSPGARLSMQGVDARSAAPRAARAARLPKARDVVGVDLEVDGRALWVGLERLRRSFAPAHACGGITFQRCGPLPNLPAGAWSHTGLHARSQQAGRGATAI